MFLNFRRRKRQLACEIDEELDFHIEMRERDNIRAGMNPQEARADALRRFGDAKYFKSRCIQVRRRYRAERIARAMKLLAWPLIAYGLVLRFMGAGKYVAQIGTTLIMIGLLWRLFLYVRARQAGIYRLNADSENALLAADHCDQRENEPYILSQEQREQIASIFGLISSRDEKTMTDDDR